MEYLEINYIKPKVQFLCNLNLRDIVGVSWHPSGTEVHMKDGKQILLPGKDYKDVAGFIKHCLN